MSSEKGLNMPRPFSVFLVLAFAGLVSASEAPAQGSCKSARTCTEAYQNCTAACMKYGLGPRRKSHPNPRSAQVCQEHCAPWRAGCMNSGCHMGDLCQVCGLKKQ